MKSRDNFLVIMAILVALGMVVWLHFVFIGQIILNPVVIRIGPIAIKWYGLIMASAIAAGYAWSYSRLVAKKVKTDQADWLLWWTVGAGIIGARLGFVLQNFQYYAANPIDILAVNHGGLSIHGAVIVGALVAWFLARKIKLPYMQLADVIAPALLLGAIIGRFGNFANYELYGYPTQVAWKMFVPLAYRMPSYSASAYFHPTFLYEALLNLAMLGIVIWVEYRAKASRVIASVAKQSQQLKSEIATPPKADRDDKAVEIEPAGQIFWLTIGLYSISRFIVEFFRIGKPFVNGLTLAQWVSLAIVLCSVVFITRSQMQLVSQIDAGRKNK